MFTSKIKQFALKKIKNYHKFPNFNDHMASLWQKLIIMSIFVITIFKMLGTRNNN